MYVHKVYDRVSCTSLAPVQMVDAEDVATRSDIVSNVVLAEIYHYQHERVVDFRDMMRCLISAKIKFYKEVRRVCVCFAGSGGMGMHMCVCMCLCVCACVRVYVCPTSWQLLFPLIIIIIID